MRTCIGCRQRELAAQMVKFVAVRGIDDTAHVVVDERGRLPGRGAWLHRDDACLSLAVRRRTFGAALRDRGVVVNPEDLAEAIGGVAHEDPLRGQDR
ncbi:YlxR family protein [Gordonia hydrophobica]|uniref:YlxR family protein n=1 Tax=Gordonia hydrophobica TaxID=40516 RepID=UPI0027DC925E|nr:YlxR family protein [Gordonia hydrophobica]